mgnify:FL=1
MAVSVPGKALGAAIKALEGRLTDEAYEQVAAFHQGVVKFLQQSSRGEVDGGLAEELESLIPPLKSALASASILSEDSE